ncbi:MAG TPA: Xaa-Pro aminopeptidase [Pyrinomonadaceae bacterium]
MKLTKKLRAITVSITLIAVSLALPFATTGAGADSKSSSSAIRVAPPAPAITDEARLAELSARRSRVAEKIGPTGILILFSGEPRVYTNDVDYEFRQENNLYYLTMLKQKGATLVMMPGNTQTPEILFLPKRDPSAETWTGHMYSPEEAQKISGVPEIWEAGEFEPFMRAVRARQPYRPQAAALLMQGRATTVSSTTAASPRPVTPPVPQSAQTTDAAKAATPANPVSGKSPTNLATANANAATPQAAPAQTNSQTPQASTVGNAAATPATNATPSGYETLYTAASQGAAELYLLLPRDTESREYKREQTFASQWAMTSSGYSIHDAWPIFTEMRLKKSPMELQFMQHAIDITGEALGRAMAVAGRSAWEYEVEAQVDYIFKLRNADNWGYPSIVGCGPNGTTLHYEESQGRVTTGDLLLMDVGAEYEHYSADVTRTFPVNGKFTPAQADIYNIVFAAQEAAARAMRPGATLTDVHNASAAVIKDGLLKLGLITDKSSNQYRIWFMHGNSHFLGMNVHDVGMRGTKLEVGMTFTNEPGIYVREDALDYLPKTPENEQFIAAVRPAFEKYKNIGVRIEDDMLITPDGPKWMTAAIPRTIPDIEAFIARASRELKVSRLSGNPFERQARQIPSLLTWSFKERS